jgi:hypothetical protein
LIQSDETKTGAQLQQLFDEHWQHWQVIWGLENAAFYNRQSIEVKRWGKDIPSDSEIILRAFTLVNNNEIRGAA